jgi:hypothetical protein
MAGSAPVPVASADVIEPSEIVKGDTKVRHHCIRKSCHARVIHRGRGPNLGRLVSSHSKRKHPFLVKLCYDVNNIHYDSWHTSCQRHVMHDNPSDPIADEVTNAFNLFSYLINF